VLSRIVTIAGQIGESALSIVGIRVGTEEPSHTTEALTDNVQLRHYAPRIAAETTVIGDEQQSRSAGFRALARYIFGANRRRDKIAMTAPVAQLRDPEHVDSERIAMTAPVAQSQKSLNSWVIRFYMPAKWTMDTLPEPDDPEVRLLHVPAESFAVLRFSGDRGARAVQTRTDELRETLREYGFEPTGPATAWFYDPPWTLPFRRRNEIAIPVNDGGA
jgi:hypothetical protein